MTLPARPSRWSQAILALSLCLAPVPAAAAANKPTPKEAKVGVYIAMINAESNHVFSNYAKYTKQVADLKKGPTCNESGVQHFVSGMGPSAPERYAGYKKALAKAPKLEVDPAAQEMLAAIEQLYKPENEASEYYFKRKFKDDACKRGGELHRELMTGWTKYMKAEEAVRAFLDKYTDERDQTELGKTEKQYGKNLRYHHSKLMIDAKALVRLTDQSELDVATLRTRLADFDATLTSARTVVEKEKQAKKNADALYQGGYEQFVSRANQFKDSVKELLRVLDEEAKDPKASTTMAQRRPNSVKALINGYNSLVEQSNKVLYSKTMK